MPSVSKVVFWIGGVFELIASCIGCAIVDEAALVILIVFFIVLPMILGLAGSIMDKPSLIWPVLFTHYLFGVVLMRMATADFSFFFPGLIVLLFAVPISQVVNQLEEDLATDKLETVTLVSAPKGPTDGYIL